MTQSIERRVIDREVELRAAPEGSKSPGILAGYAVVFDSLSRDLGGWVEEIAPDAAGAPLEGGVVDMALHTRVIARAEHDSRLLLGTTDAETLRLYIDEVGVRYEVDLPNTGAGRDVAVLAERGDYRHSSFAFHALDVDWREDADGRLVRRVTRLVLSDVSPVADPAYWAATTGLQQRDVDEARASLTPTPAVPGEWEIAAAERAAARQTRETHPALASRTRKRGR
ncbi:HK97 family phage prohead protease [Microbacterium marinum]|uniref:HK97 family phage prohead protease n=1 Tax=Microbacterium marinum TaxID=421115 RepID=A0A7W7BQL7_9MICO|nr:HK97 family phage prohead protease [Microbacterium marinum]MBB4666975.1 HK97 family phage prohead protease [Microbacterium marinum]